MATLAARPPVRHGTCYLKVFINGKEYSCHPVPRVELPSACKKAFRLVRLDTASRYYLLRMHGSNSCSCPDHSNRKAHCKHLRALEALGLLSPRRARPSELRKGVAR